MGKDFKGGDVDKRYKEYEASTAGWFKDMMEGLTHMQKNDIFYQDCRPGNTMLCYDASQKLIAKLADFGTSRYMKDPDTWEYLNTQQVMGPYAPGDDDDCEENQTDECRDQITTATLAKQMVALKGWDIWSLGMVGIEMFTPAGPWLYFHV